MKNLVEVLGVDGAADRLLATGSPSEIEEFFQAHHASPKLSWYTLLRCLSQEVPEGNEHAAHRSVAAKRIVQEIDIGNAYARLQLEDVVREVRPPELREDLLDRLFERASEQSRLRLAFVASGGTTFCAVRDHEALKEMAPPGFVVGPHVPLLTPDLFPVRTNEDACLGVLRDATQLKTTRLYAIWVLAKTGLLPSLGTPEAVLGSVPTLEEVEPEEWAHVRILLACVREWPEEVRRAWHVKRALAAVERGVSWHSLWWEIEPEFRDDAALASVGTVRPAPWALPSITRRCSGPTSWEMAFPLLERAPSEDDTESFNKGTRLGEGLFERRVTDEEVKAALNDSDARSTPAWMLKAPLPTGADDSFDERFVNAALRWPLFAHGVVQRLLELPLTERRARRLVQHGLAQGWFWGHARCLEIAQAAGVCENVRLPEPIDGHVVEAFRVLVGERADDLIGEHLDELTEKRALHEALRFSTHAAFALTEDRKTALRRQAYAHPLTELAVLASQHPWIASQADLEVEADVRDDWGNVEYLPAFLSRKIEARALTTPDSRTAAKLLDRLLALGAHPRDVLALGLQRLRALGLKALHPDWFGQYLNSKSLWNEPGCEIVAVLLGHRTGDAANRVLCVCLEADGRHRGSDLVGAMHTTIATVLVRFADDALQADDIVLGRRALRALAHLSPSSRLRPSVCALRRHERHVDLVGEIELNENLLRRKPEPALLTFDAIKDALLLVVYGDEQRRSVDQPNA